MKNIKVLLAAALMAGSGLASAGQLAIGTASGNAGTNIGPVSISFAGDGSTVGFQNDISYNETLLGQPTLSAQNAATCTRPAAGVIRVIKLDLSLTPLPGASTNYCNATFPVPGGTAASSYPLTAANFATPPNGCSDAGGGNVACTSTPGSVVVNGVVTPLGPSIAYNPAAGAAAGTGGPVNFTGVGAVGSTGAGQIVATPSGGAVAGTATTVGNFQLTGADAANFAVTSAATLTFNQGTNTAQNINMTCTAGAAARTANLQATETITGGATSQRFWVLSCPAGSAAAVPPTLTYVPAPGSSNNVAAGVALTIGVGCPTDGSACTGSGTGLAATSRLESLSATYAGPMFSPLPTMVCAFVTEGGTPTGGNTLDFVALTADPGDIRCTCPANTSGLPTEPFTVTVLERSPASGAGTVTRNFSIVCGAPPPVCGTVAYVNQAPNATINLTNGGAASPVSTVSLTGASNGVSQTITCATSNVSAGSTFTVTTNPTPLVVSTTPTLGGSISAACTNSAETTGTATLTCTGVSTTQGCTSTTQFTLSCPGQAAPPPPSEFVPVPALNEQGRILLAALVLLMGLGVVGFRMRG